MFLALIQLRDSNEIAIGTSFMDRISSFGTELKWLLGRCDPAISLSQGQGYGRGVYDAFRMLQSDPSVKVSVSFTYFALSKDLDDSNIIYRPDFILLIQDSLTFFLKQIDLAYSF